MGKSTDLLSGTILNLTGGKGTRIKLLPIILLTTTLCSCGTVKEPAKKSTVPCIEVYKLERPDCFSKYETSLRKERIEKYVSCRRPYLQWIKSAKEFSKEVLKERLELQKESSDLMYGSTDIEYSTTWSYWVNKGDTAEFKAYTKDGGMLAYGSVTSSDTGDVPTRYIYLDKKAVESGRVHRQTTRGTREVRTMFGTRTEYLGSKKVVYFTGMYFCGWDEVFTEATGKVSADIYTTEPCDKGLAIDPEQAKVVKSIRKRRALAKKRLEDSKPASLLLLKCREDFYTDAVEAEGWLRECKSYTSVPDTEMCSDAQKRP